MDFSTEAMVSERKSVKLSGKLKGEEHRNQIGEMMSRLREQDFGHLELDLEKVEDIDFDTLALLLTIKKELQENNKAVELTNVPKRIQRILELFRVQGATY